MACLVMSVLYTDDRCYQARSWSGSASTAAQGGRIRDDITCAAVRSVTMWPLRKAYPASSSNRAPMRGCPHYPSAGCRHARISRRALRQRQAGRPTFRNGPAVDTRTSPAPSRSRSGPGPAARRRPSPTSHRPLPARVGRQPRRARSGPRPARTGRSARDHRPRCQPAHIAGGRIARSGQGTNLPGAATAAWACHQ
jgi:hypothetical protein